MKTKENLRRVTSASVQGGRSHQEDRVVKFFFRRKQCRGYVLAVMDGHGGSAAAEICAQNIQQFFSLDTSEEVEEALRRAVAGLNALTKDLFEGTTLSIACILESHNKVSVAVLGDSPIVILDEEGVVHYGPDHNIRTNPSARREAEERGGDCFSGYVLNHSGEEGVQFSRALGDSGMGSILLREPEIRTFRAPCWVVVASDGVFDPGHRDSGKLLDEFSGLGKERADAERIIAWAQRGPSSLSDNASVAVWRKL